jgi:hypothetical protein
MNTRNLHRWSQADPFEPERPLQRATRATIVFDAISKTEGFACPADGQACERADGDCEVCGRSALTY